MTKNNGRLLVCEIKDGSKPPSARRLTENEECRRAMLEAHGVSCHIVTCIDDLLKLREAMRPTAQEAI